MSSVLCVRTLRLTLRHPPICDKDVYLYLRTKRYRCLDCDARPTTTERCEWYDADAKCAKAFAEFLLRAFVNSAISDVSIKLGINLSGAVILLLGCRGREKVRREEEFRPHAYD